MTKNRCFSLAKSLLTRVCTFLRRRLKSSKFSLAAVAVNRNSARCCHVAESAVGTQGLEVFRGCSCSLVVTNREETRCSGSAAADDTLHSGPRVSHNFAPRRHFRRLCRRGPPAR
ncbi:unnamed protein product [Ixodes pacificus]